MKYVYKLWLRIEGLFGFQWRVNHTRVLVFLATFVLAFGVFYAGYRSVLATRNAQIAEEKRLKRAESISKSVKMIKEDTFAEEVLALDDAIYGSVSKNPSVKQAEGYLLYLANMYDEDTVKRAQVQIPWKDDNVRYSVELYDDNTYSSRVSVPITVAKTYGGSFETYIGLFDVVVYNKQGEKFNTKSSVTLTFNEGVAVSWSMSERNLK